MTLIGTLCLECYKGYLQPQTGAGRMFALSKDVEFELPHDLEIPTCDHCKELWFTGKLLDQIIEMSRTL